MASSQSKKSDDITYEIDSRDRNNQPIRHISSADDKNENQTEVQDTVSKNSQAWRSSYDPFQKADLNQAEIHRRAVQVRKVEGCDIQNSQKCLCCGYPLDAPEFSMCDSVLDFKELGPGFPQFFYMSRYILGILILCMIIAGFPCWIHNLHTNDASEWDEENDNFTIRSSVGSQGKGDEIMPFWHSILHIIAMILIAISYHFMRKYIRTKEEEIDIFITTPSDYTIWATNIDVNLSEEELKTFFVEYGRADGIRADVVKINFPYDIKKFVKVSRKLKAVNEQISYIEEYRKQERNMEALPEKTVCCFKKTMESYENLIKTKDKLETDLRNAFQEMTPGNAKNRLIGQAFVTFREQKEARLVARNLQQDFSRKLKIFCTYLNCTTKTKKNKKNKFGHKVYATLAPEPNDIVWENLSASYGKRLKKGFMTYLISFFALCVSFGIAWGCSYYQDKVNDSSNSESLKNEWKVRVNSIWPSIIIVIINFILGRAIRYFSSMGLHQTFTMYNLSVATKLTVAQCVNTALITMIVNLDKDERWFISGGLVADMTYVLISNAFVQPLVYLFSPLYMLKLCKMRKAEKDPYLNQAEANLIWEGPEVDMAQRYANLMKTLIVTLAYAPILPMGILISIAGLIFEYWIDKYLLIRRHKRPARLSGALAEAMGAFVSWAVLIYAIMNYVFMAELNEENSMAAFIWMMIVIGYFILPIQAISKMFDKENIDKFEQNKPYEEACVEFVDDYDRTNPVTSAQATREYIAFLDKKAEAENQRSRLNSPRSPDSGLNSERQIQDPNVMLESDLLNQMNNYALYSVSLNQYANSFVKNTYSAPTPSGYGNSNPHNMQEQPLNHILKNASHLPVQFYANYGYAPHNPMIINTPYVQNIQNLLLHHLPNHVNPPVGNDPNPQIYYPPSAPYLQNSHQSAISDYSTVKVQVASAPVDSMQESALLSQQVFLNPKKKRKILKRESSSDLQVDPEENKQKDDSHCPSLSDNRI